LNFKSLFIKEAMAFYKFLTNLYGLFTGYLIGCFIISLIDEYDEPRIHKFNYVDVIDTGSPKKLTLINFFFHILFSIVITSMLLQLWVSKASEHIQPKLNKKNKENKENIDWNRFAQNENSLAFEQSPKPKNIHKIDWNRFAQNENSLAFEQSPKPKNIHKIDWNRFAQNFKLECI
jgi:hypothetical protein